MDLIVLNTRKCKAQASRSLLSAMSFHPYHTHSDSHTEMLISKVMGLRSGDLGRGIDDKCKTFQNEVSVLTKELRGTLMG